MSLNNYVHIDWKENYMVYNETAVLVLSDRKPQYRPAITKETSIQHTCRVQYSHFWIVFCVHDYVNVRVCACYDDDAFWVWSKRPLDLLVHWGARQHRN